MAVAFGSDEFVALAVYVDDFDGRIVLEVLAQLGDVDVHGTCVEVVVVDPNGLERIVAFENFVDVSTEKAEEFGFLSGELGDFVADEEHLLLGIESEFWRSRW